MYTVCPGRQCDIRPPVNEYPAPGLPGQFYYALRQFEQSAIRQMFFTDLYEIHAPFQDTPNACKEGRSSELAAVGNVIKKGPFIGKKGLSRVS